MNNQRKTEKPKIRKKEFEIKLLSDNAILPKKAVRGAIGYDLCLPCDFRVPAHSRVAIPLDIAINLPNGVEGKIEPRSGCSLHGIEGYGTRTIIKGKILGLFPKKEIKSGKMYFNADVCVGKVDPNYTDNIHVIVVNHDESFLIRKGSRIAQLTFYQTIAPFFKEVEKLTCQSRGGGLGHTGVSRYIMRSAAADGDKTPGLADCNSDNPPVSSSHKSTPIPAVSPETSYTKQEKDSPENEVSNTDTQSAQSIFSIPDTVVDADTDPADIGVHI